MKIDCRYEIKKDLLLALDDEKITFAQLALECGLSRGTLEEALETPSFKDEVYEKFYSFLYRSGYRVNKAKEEMAKESYGCVLFHGSKLGLEQIGCLGSRPNCDFGPGFYLGESYSQALAFVCAKEGSSVYSFAADFDGLSEKRFSCDLDWMLAICHYRGALKRFGGSPRIAQAIAEAEKADLIIAPIADNKMYFVMSRFVDGDINAEVALHSLAASNLGLQYVFKSEKAIERLRPLERYYLSQPEKRDCMARAEERSKEIDTKLKLAKREFVSGLYIEEILK